MFCICIIKTCMRILCRDQSRSRCDFQLQYLTSLGLFKQMASIKHGHGLSLAVAAGFMAALGSTSAKLATSQSAVNKLCHIFISSNICNQITLYARCLFFVLIFLCNGMMWTLFTKSLQLCPSSVEATITNTASNFLLSAIVGVVLFDESLSLRWWSGASLILLGLLLIHRASGKDDVKDKSS